MVFGQFRRAAVILAPSALIAAALGAVAASPAMADTGSVTSPTGLVTVSVPTPVEAGVASTYTMTVTNTMSTATDGPAGIVASGSMPAGVTIQRIAGCSKLGGNQSTSFLCSMPNLAPGASESATFSLVASAAGDYQIPFGAAGEVPDPDDPGASTAFGDSATLPVSVQPAPTDIQVTGSSSNGSPAVGEGFDYTFQVKDNGPLPASGVTFDDTLPPGIQLGNMLVISGGGTCTPAVGSIHCDIGGLATGQQSTIVFSATPTQTGTFANTATVGLSGTDTNPANNSVTVTVQPR